MELPLLLLPLPGALRGAPIPRGVNGKLVANMDGPAKFNDGDRLLPVPVPWPLPLFDVEEEPVADGEDPEGVLSDGLVELLPDEFTAPELDEPGVEDVDVGVNWAACWICC